MARSALSVQRINRNGLTPAYEAANVDGNSFTNSGHQFLHLKNGGTAAQTITIQTPLQVHGLAVADLSVSVAAGSEVMLGPFPQRTFGGEVLVDYSAVTSLTVGVFV